MWLNEVVNAVFFMVSLLLIIEKSKTLLLIFTTLLKRVKVQGQMSNDSFFRSYRLNEKHFMIIFREKKHDIHLMHLFRNFHQYMFLFH